MQIAHNVVVSLIYTLRDASGAVLDQSSAAEPLAYLHGNGNLIPGLERELEGKTAGEKLQVTVAPEDGYGVPEKGLIQQVPRRAFQGIAKVEPGMRFYAETEHGHRQVVVTHVAGDMVTVDGNHPLAGQTLHFEVEIAEVREASAEELEHGHVHGPGGHHH